MLTYRTTILTDLWDQIDVPCRPDEEFWSPRAKRLCEWWWREHQGRIPLKSRFDILEHLDAAPDIFLVEVQSDGSFLTRIIGENAKISVEESRLGLLICHDDERRHIRELHAHYNLVAQSKIPFRCVCRAIYDNKKHAVFEGVDCPLSLDGYTVSHIIGILTLQQDR
jgi:hypothetical protein